MKKILLTSTGLENENIKAKFLELLDKEPQDVKALFVTTAAVEPDAIMVLPKCLEDLLNCNIKENNITVYDMHKVIPIEELVKYDVIYVCGGSTKYLVDRITELNIKPLIDEYLKQGGIYLGVSAGSVAASGNYPNGLNFLTNELDVHCHTCSNTEDLSTKNKIFLDDNSAILINEEEKIIFS